MKKNKKNSKYILRFLNQQRNVFIKLHVHEDKRRLFLQLTFTIYIIRFFLIKSKMCTSNIIFKKKIEK